MNKANECTCPSGNGSLAHPCPAHPAPAEQAGGDERAGLRAAAKWHRGQRNAFEAEAEMHRQRYENTNRPDSLTAEAEHHRRLWETASAMAANHLDYAAGFEEMARAALAQPSPVRSSLLINGYQLRAALEFIAPDGTAKQLESEARIEWRQQDADFLEAGLYAWCAEYPEEGCVLLDEEPATAQPSPAQAEKAEVERPEVVGQLVTWPTGQRYVGRVRERKGCKTEDVMTVAQHERIVAFRWERVMDLMGEHVARISEKLTAERDAALAKCAELTATRNRYGLDAHYFNKNLQRILRDFGSFTPDELARSLIILAKVADEKVVAQAQHSVPETINEEANSFLRIADAGQFKDNAAAVRTAAMIIRGLLHRPAIMKSIIRHRIGLTPDYEGQWHADLYGEDGEVQHHAEADTPDEAVRAVVALAAAPGKEGV